eukprot:213279-Pyramimonas_sp.AAC.1
MRGQGCCLRRRAAAVPYGQIPAGTPAGARCFRSRQVRSSNRRHPRVQRHAGGVLSDPSVPARVALAHVLRGQTNLRHPGPLAAAAMR